MTSLVKLYKLVQVAGRCLVQHKLRSALSVLGVVCGVIAVLAMVAIGEGAKQRVIQQIEQLGIGNIYIKALTLAPDQQRQATEKLSQGLQVQDARRLAKGCSQIDSLGWLKTVAAPIVGIPQEGAAPQIAAVNPGYGRVQGLLEAQGRFIAHMDLEQRNLVCVLGAEVATSTGQPWLVGQFMRIGAHLFKVVGILAPIHHTQNETVPLAARDHNNMVFIPFATQVGLETRRQRIGAGKNTNQLTEIVVRVAATEDVLPAARIIRRIIAVSHHQVPDVEIILPLQLLQRAKATQRTFNLVMGAIAALSLLVGGIGIMNIMLATVTERTQEIGVRRAVGATKSDIVFQFVIETVTLTVIGGAVGVVSGIGVVHTMARIGGWPVAITPWAIAMPLLMAIGVGIFFGLYPACKAANMNPAHAFRYG